MCVVRQEGSTGGAGQEGETAGESGQLGQCMGWQLRQECRSASPDQEWARMAGAQARRNERTWGHEGLRA